jgi:hypothetical protein
MNESLSALFRVPVGNEAQIQGNFHHRPGNAKGFFREACINQGHDALRYIQGLRHVGQYNLIQKHMAARIQNLIVDECDNLPQQPFHFALALWCEVLHDIST